jgi:hypothetical protein
VKLDPLKSLHQVFQPWIQRRKLAYAKHKHVISGILRHAQMQSLGRLLNDDGTPNEQVIRKCDSFPLSTAACCVCPVARSLAHCFRSCRLFRKIDMDESRSLSRAELHALIVGINFEEVDFDRTDAVDKVMDDFDTSRNDVVEEEEFVQGMRKWLDEARRSVPVGGAFSSKFIHEYHEVQERTASSGLLGTVHSVNCALTEWNVMGLCRGRGRSTTSWSTGPTRRWRAWRTPGGA